MKPLYIFDLDGTLCDITHRRHFVTYPTEHLDFNWKPDWTSFYAACVKDTPKKSVIATMELLLESSDVWVWSGRSDEVRRQTEWWLESHTGLAGWEKPENLRMRAYGDHRPDEVIKREWYDMLPDRDKERLIAVFDDRDRMVKMWRDLGITCFQVAPGDF